MQNTFLQAKCRMLLTEYADVFEYIQREIGEELLKERMIGETSFEIAKKAIRREAMQEGITLLMQKINKHASERPTR